MNDCAARHPSLGVAIFSFMLGILIAPAEAGMGVSCSTPREVAAVQLFEYIEDPRFNFDSREEYQNLFSVRLLKGSSSSTVTSLLREARSTYQDNRSETPLSRRLLAPPSIIEQRGSSPRNEGETTVRVLTLSSRGKIEQRMSITCEDGLWKVDSLSYGPPSMGTR